MKYPIPESALTQHIVVLRRLPRGTPIARLFASRCPAAIARLVVAIVVWVAIDGMLRGRPLTHVRQKALEAIAPSITNGNAAAAIIRIVGAPLVVAAILHSLPRVVLGAFCQTMRAIGCSDSLPLEAAARHNPFSQYRAAVEASEELEHVDGKFRSRPEFAASAPIDAGASIDEWASKLPPAYGKMLRAIYESGPLDKDTVADLAGVSRTSSGLGSGLRELISLQLVTDQGGQYDVAEGLR